MVQFSIMDENELIHALATLSALKENLPAPTQVSEKYVNEFHEVLEGLARSTGSDLRRYRVPPDELRHIVTSIAPRRLRRGRLVGGTTHSDGRFCERAFLMMKIDTVLKSFQIGMSAARPIGFTAA
jgi:hypothetical protein